MAEIAKIDFVNRIAKEVVSKADANLAKYAKAHLNASNMSLDFSGGNHANQSKTSPGTVYRIMAG